MTQAATTDSLLEGPTSLGGRPPNAPSCKIRLNAFQILMRRWSQLHPYNAGQVMEVSGPGDRDRWKIAIEAVIGELELGTPRSVAGRCNIVQFMGVSEIAIDQSSQDLEAFFNDEINRPFAAKDLPIRFCILPGTHGPDSHCLAAVYDHWIADSRAMRELMHRIFERYQNPECPSKLKPLSLETPNFNALFRHHVGLFTKTAAIRESIKNVWRHRHGFRVNIADPLDLNSRFFMRELPKGLIDKVHRVAKAHGASVNDAFIAVLGQAMDGYTASERAYRRKKLFHFKRQRIGIGTIVDIRDAAKEPLDEVFNLYLSSYTVVLDKPESVDPATLTATVAKQTAALKKSFATVKGFWALVMARFWYDTYDSKRFRAQMLHKTVPVVAGISNVNMTRSWVDQPAGGREDLPRVLNYLRISPTGPLIPLVFTLTTIAGRLSLCVTYRTQSFSEQQARCAADSFVQRLAALAE